MKKIIFVAMFFTLLIGAVYLIGFHDFNKDNDVSPGEDQINVPADNDHAPIEVCTDCNGDQEMGGGGSWVHNLEDQKKFDALTAE